MCSLAREVEMIVEGEVDRATANVLLVEDHASFRQALAFVFEREPEFSVVAQSGSIEEARKSVEGVDLAVVDLGLPDGDGTTLIEELSDSDPGVSALVLTASLESERFDRAVEAGAAGVLHKSASIEEIVDAARRLKNGQALISPAEMFRIARETGRRRREEMEARQAIEKLTRREKEVLQALGEGLDSKDIADKLYITVETERTHMVNILGKLDLRSRLQALVFAVRHGLVEIR